MATQLAVAPSSDVRTSRWDAGFWACVIVCVLLLASAIRPSTLWIDEGFSVWIACHHSIRAVTETLFAGDVRDLQMPGHYYWLWAWARVFGSSEYSIRAANLPFALVFVLSIAITSRCVFRRRFAWMPMAVAPFAWTYVNEARPYFMLMSFSAAAVGGALAWSFGSGTPVKRAPWMVCSAGLAAIVTHMLAGLAFPGILVIIGASYRKRRPSEWKSWLAPLLLFGIPTAAIALFYASTLPRMKTDGYDAPSSLMFAGALYQHGGLKGLGPVRNNVSSVDLMAFIPYLPWLAAGVIALAVVCSNLFRRPWDIKTRTLATAWALSFGLALAASYSVNAVFLGRHISALFPFFLLFLISVAPSARQCLLLAAVWLAADVRLSFLRAYGKDNYRAAVRDVIGRNGVRPGQIAWSADPLTAYYYGLALDDVKDRSPYEMNYAWMAQRVDWPARARGVIVCGWTARAVDELVNRQRQSRHPLYLVLSRPESYDKSGVLRRVVSRPGAKRVASYTAFDIFTIE